ncbi:Bowman-Birk type seed trypsin and chymotrypsin inhibitor-like [Vigna unguiculata]|uniref:Proteinase inhibitor I12 n=1 Tax=Vigna unguiculata TaxID=3917 RepID=A0A4D6M4W0_VIGUN|nr:Bowman-Birk type seed trypsin and chymotrypsin inhibitor-like [Vigna unguiculata]QCD95034.1 Proteinase inhibitor I12 [Vigna unguiculata]WNK89149.1 trypsin-chymotrypsin Bowman-Birk protease inhibitor [Vigna unguiculata]WNK89151.1 trypsin-chymotrypsin Bowman-Birk protease inhibitor [Vigna unguiculata]WNK89175.1 trypsin-chymotrypsin Bowman-Birk protease inhibitor [Vigna unguiculata]
MVVKVCLMLLFLLGTCSASLKVSEVGQVIKSGDHHEATDEPSESSEACCDRCECTKSIPPQCRCSDVRLNSCHSACKSCACTFSIPAQCFCGDINDFCYKPCKSSSHDDDDWDK